MTVPEPTSDLRVENALLRSALWLAARALRTYHDAAHVEIDDDGIPMMKVVVPTAARDKAADAIARADRMLTEPEKSTGR